MSPIADVGRSLLGRIGGQHSTTVQAGLKVEVTELRKLKGEFAVIKESIKGVRAEMDQLAASAEQAMNAVQGVRSGGHAKSQNGTPQFSGNFTSSSAPPKSSSVGHPTSGAAMASAVANGRGPQGSAMGGVRGMFANFGGSGMAAMVLSGMAGNVVGALDQRIDRGMSYASDADRLNIILQQQTGKSQMQVMNQMRKPLANYRLGADGVSQILAFESQYGMQQGSMNAQSVAGLRALSGYTKTTADVLRDQQAALAPQAANRMYNMLGVNAYTAAGGVRDPMQMQQQMTQALGLTNNTVLKGARSQGSAVRAMMTDAGIPLEMQDTQLEYAQSNLTFQNKTGGKQGMYDPSKKSHMKIMGIEENFATQQEETEKLRGQREEDFARRHIDNMAALERSNQTLVKALGSLEDAISPLIGARTSTRGITSLLGRGMQIVGAGIAIGSGGTLTPLGVGMMAGGSLLAGGDPTEGASGSSGGASGGGSSDTSRDSSIAIPVGYNGKRASLNEVKQRPDFRSMNPKMQDRLLSMFRENPNVGIGGGMRNSSEQETMFKSRYRRTTKKTDIEWDGSYWEHVSGAPAAPPGRSMHEIGLAADLIGDLGWMNANAARFGLKHFAGVNNEPWHVQPSELPNSRREYEKGGAAWGTDGGFVASDNFGTTTGSGSDAESGHVQGGVKGSGIRSFENMSINEILAVMEGDAAGRMGGASSASSTQTTTSSTKSNSPATSAAVGPSGALPGEAVARFASGAGFRGQNLINMVAIAKRESGWRPRAYNGNLNTGDQSYGLWQLNTLNKKGAGMMGDLFNGFLGLPQGNTNFDALFDPATNARGAKFLSDRSGGTLNPWGGYKGKDDTYNTNVAEATQIVKQAGLGDPMPSDSMRGEGSPRGGGSTHLSHAPTYQISVSPQITFVGTPGTADLRKIASEVTAMMADQVRTLEMRGA